MTNISEWNVCASRDSSKALSENAENPLSEVLDVKDDLKCENFLMLLASNSGEELVYDNYAKQIGVYSPTVKEWISSLAETGIIRLARS